MRLPIFGLLAIALACTAAKAQMGNPFETPRPAGNPFETPAPTATRVVLRLAQMNDPGTSNIPSHTILVPEGWKLKGGAWWSTDQRMLNVAPSQWIRVDSPDGRMVQIMPGMLSIDPHWTPAAMQNGNQRPPDGTSMNGLLVETMPDSDVAWRSRIERLVVRALEPNAQGVTLDPLKEVPALNALLQRSIAAQRQINAQQDQAYGNLTRTTLDGNVYATLAHYSLNGKKFEQLIMFGTCAQTMQSMLSRDVQWTVDPCVSYRAEEGQLGATMPLLMAVANSMRPTEAWSRMKAEHMAAMAGIQAKGVADRINIWANANAEINKIITQGFNERQGVQDRVFDNYTKGFRGVADYVAPDGGALPAQLPHDYARVFGTAQGEYILTNDVNYNPNADPSLGGGRTWAAMEPQK